MIIELLLLSVAVAAGCCAIVAWQRVAHLRGENARLAERLEQIQHESPQREKAGEDRFRLLAAEILASNSRDLRRQQEEHLGYLLDPLKRDIEEFRRRVTDCYDNEARERFSLKERIRELIELNRSIGREAKDLTVALRGNSKVQGDWGEMVLETILEKSGLRKGTEFVVQETTDISGRSLRNEEGTQLRPDVVVYYPDGRCVVVDSKVSLTAYMNMVNADDPDDERKWAERHLASVRSHISELRRKSYQDYVGERRTDFVMMFIPNEPAYITAMRLDPDLWQEAYDSRVLLVSPTHLISALRLVAQLWRQDRQSRNAADIAVAAGRMLDKFVGFTTDMDRVRKALDSAVEAHASAMKKLSDGPGNLTSRARKLRDMGAKSTKSIPGGDDDAAELSERGDTV